jgi:hypothetical protein
VIAAADRAKIRARPNEAPPRNARFEAKALLDEGRNLKSIGGVGRRRVCDGKETNNRVFAFTQDHQDDGARAILHALFAAPTGRRIL